MNDVAPTPSMRSPLAATYLAVSFAAGLLFVYWLDASRSEGPAGAASGAADVSRSAQTEPPTPSSPQAAAYLAAKMQSLSEQVVAAERRVQVLEDAMAALKTEQAAGLASLRQEIADRPQAAAPGQEVRDSGQDARPQGEAVVGSAAGLSGEEAALDAQLASGEAKISLGEAELRFLPGRAGLAERRPESLSKVAEQLKRRPGLNVRLRGYTDSSGEAAMNQALSEKRALAVRDALVALGIASERIQAEGLGEADPIADNGTPEGRARNRRVEVLLSSH
jgi:outer membrane protein OmpA-like peptidoglycan-associated protein